MDTGIFGRWGESYFGRPEDQPLISAVTHFGGAACLASSAAT